MKKIIISFTLLALFGCSKDSEQVTSLKTQLVKDYGKSQAEVDSYTYTVHDAYSKEVFSAIMDKELKKAEMDADLGVLDTVPGSNTKIDSLLIEEGKQKDKKFYAVRVYKLRDKDTIKNITYYLNDKNEVLAVKQHK